MTDIQPILLSAITCNRVIFDKVSGMPSVIDIIQMINAPSFPTRHPRMVFFCELTNGHGTTGINIRLVDVQQDEKVIFERAGTAQFNDVRQILTLAMDLHGIVFSHPGEYRFQLFASGCLLGERRVVCREAKRPRTAKPDESTQ